MAEVRDGLLEEARAAYTRSDYARALGEVEQAWPLIEGLAGDERDECLTDAYELRAFVYRSQGAFERAVEALQSMLAHARTPERALDARALLGGMLVVRGQYDEAVALLSEVE